MYKKHRIKKDGHIEIKEEINEKPVWTIVKPNQPIEKYNEQIESDPDFEKYRTQENADAYEASLKELEPTAEELEQQEERRQLQEKRKQAKQELKGSRPPQSNPELAKRVEKLEFVMGIRDEVTE